MQVNEQSAWMNKTALQLDPDELLELLVVSIQQGWPVLIKGGPGTAKTAVMMQAAAATDRDTVVFIPSLKQPTDVAGLPWVVDGEAVFVLLSDLKRLVNPVKPTVCVIDDLGQAAASVQKALMHMLLAREINGHPIHPEVAFVAATNRKGDKAGVDGVLEPVKSRFLTIVELVPSVKSWINWALTANVDVRVIAFISHRPELLYQFSPTADLTNSPCPRTIEHASRVLSLGLTPRVQFAAIAGAAGEGFATELTSFLQIEAKLPHPDQILANPDTAPVPPDHETAVLAAICSALSTRASIQTADRIYTYANRLPDEFAMLLNKLVLSKHPGVVRTKGHVTFAATHNHMEF